MTKQRTSPLLPLLVLALFATTTTAQEPATTFDEDTWQERPGVYVGTAGCGGTRLCHGAAVPAVDDGDDVRNDEYAVWLQDPHRLDAYRVLESSLARQIARTVQPGGNATEMKLCLDCHGIAAAPAERAGLVVEEGISCEGCHGPAGGWADRHYESGWSRAQSLAAGLVDLRRPAVRAALCGSCHLGDAERRVDHGLIAAGHPQLRFELDNYTASERFPRHWFLTPERAEPRAESHGPRAWAVGQAVAFAEGLDQLTTQARSSGPWPELSQLSCRSCHHALESGWREQPGYRYRGGLPPWSPARWAALKPLVAELAPGRLAELEEKVTALAGALSSFAARDEVARRAESLRAALTPLTADFDGAKWSPERAWRLIRTLAAERELALADVISAEQVALALNTLTAYLIEREAAQVSGTLAQRVGNLFAALDKPEHFDRERYAAALAAIAGGG